MAANEELSSFMNAQIEALRIENSRLMDLTERLTNFIEVKEAELVSNQYPENRLYIYQTKIN